VGARGWSDLSKENASPSPLFVRVHVPIPTDPPLRLDVDGAGFLDYSCLLSLIKMVVALLLSNGIPKPDCDALVVAN
jgi:hypothetical protein